MESRPVLQYNGAREKEQGMIWSDWRVQWSPRGSYVTTYHLQGVALWAGDDFTKKVRLPHQGVKAVEFSPTEDYVLLWNGETSMEMDKSMGKNAYALYHILTGQ